MSLGDVLTVLSILVAAAALVHSRRQAIRSGQVTVLLGLGTDFREAWRTRWRTIPPALSAVEGVVDDLAPEELENLVDALNWLDWFGVACSERIIQDPDFILATIGPSMAALLDGAAPKLAKDRQANGSQYWSGLTHLERLLNERGLVRSSASWDAAAATG